MGSIKRLKGEVFKPFKGTHGDYMISNMGRILSCLHEKERIIKQDKNSMGYPLATITLKGKSYRFLVHRQVYAHFNGTLTKQCIIHHKDENIKNSKSKNLAKTTKKAHIQYHFSKLPNIHHPGKVRVKQYSKSGKFLQEYKTITDAARSVNRSVTSITNCCNGNVKVCANYQWKYA